jgi:hypothetical protein
MDRVRASKNRQGEAGTRLRVNCPHCLLGGDGGMQGTAPLHARWHPLFVVLEPCQSFLRYPSSRLLGRRSAKTLIERTGRWVAQHPARSNFSLLRHSHTCLACQGPRALSFEPDYPCLLLISVFPLKHKQPSLPKLTSSMQENAAQQGGGQHSAQQPRPRFQRVWRQHGMYNRTSPSIFSMVPSLTAWMPWERRGSGRSQIQCRSRVNRVVRLTFCACSLPWLGIHLLQVLRLG